MQQIEYPTRFTKGQLKIDKILKEAGFFTEMEYPVGSYRLDIFLPSFDIGIEYDGIMHWKKRDEKRDAFIKKEAKIDIIRITDKNLKKEYIIDSIKELIKNRHG